MSLKSDQLSPAVAFLESLDVPSLLAKVAEEQATGYDHPTEAAPSGPLVIDLKGLESMHAPEKTSILFSAPVDASERLYPFCLTVQKLFKDNGFLVEDDRNLKLHATIVNTIYAKGKKLPVRRTGNAPAGKPPVSEREEGASTASGASRAQQDDGSVQRHGPNGNAPLKMDARAILEKYKDFVWSESVSLDRLAICEMGAKKVTDGQGNLIGEQYTEVASIKLPT